MATFQGFFRRGQKYTSVRYIRLSSSEVLEPGIDIPSKKYPLKPFHIRSLFNRRRIGFKDSPWTKAMLESLENTRALPELDKQKAIEAKQKAIEIKKAKAAEAKIAKAAKKAKAKEVKKAKAEAAKEAKAAKVKAAKEAKEAKGKATSKAEPEAKTKPATNGGNKTQPWLAK